MSVVRTARVPRRAELLIELIPRTALVTFATIVGAAAPTAVAAQLLYIAAGAADCRCSRVTSPASTC